MKQWLKRTVLIGLSVLTLGFVSPQTWQQVLAKGNDREELEWSLQEQVVEPPFNYEQFVGEIRDNTAHKLGTRILPKVSTSFNDVIVPKMVEAIEQLAATTDRDLKQLVIEQGKQTDDNEQIFFVNDARTGEQLMRFHVRKDLKPLEGYWFNFHYHSIVDNFVEHHVLTEVFWSKNQPPKWLN